MVGTAKKMINKLITEKGMGDRFSENSIRVKLMLKGIPVDEITLVTQDDDGMIERIKRVGKEFGITL